LKLSHVVVEKGRAPGTGAVCIRSSEGGSGVSWRNTTPGSAEIEEGVRLWEKEIMRKEKGGEGPPTFKTVDISQDGREETCTPGS